MISEMLADSNLADQVRQHLPLWVWVAPPVVALVVVFVMSYLVSALAARLALRPLARAEAAPWTERARLLFSAAIGQERVKNALLFAAACVATATSAPLHALSGWRLLPLLGLAAVGGYVAGCSNRFEAARFPGGRNRYSFTTLALSSLLGFLRSPWIVLLLLAIMPMHFGPGALAICVIAGIAIGRTTYGNSLRPLRRSGLLSPATPPLRSMVRELAEKYGQPEPDTWVYDAREANAFAYANDRQLIITRALLTRLPALQVRAVLAHEFGHLTESRWNKLTRLLMACLPVWVALAYPILGEYGLAVAAGYVVVLYLLARRIPGWLRRFEHRADETAHDSTDDPTHFGRAIEAITRINLTPVAFAADWGTHPQTYDRMIAAGVTPTYPRPAPPVRWPGGKLEKAALWLLVLAPLVVAIKWKRGMARAFYERDQPAAAIALGCMNLEFVSELGFDWLYFDGTPAPRSSTSRDEAEAGEQRAQAGLDLLEYVAQRRESAWSRLDLAHAYIDAGRDDLAVHWIAEAMRAEGAFQNEEVQLESAAEYARLGRHAECAELVSRFDGTFPEEEDTHDLLTQMAMACAGAGRPEEALRWIRLAHNSAREAGNGGAERDYILDAAVRLDGSDVPGAAALRALLE